MDAILVSNVEFAKLLIDKGANVDYADEEGVTVLTQAAYMGLKEIVEQLIAKGSDVTIANNEGISPLLAAASEGHDECLELILATKKADVDTKVSLPLSNISLSLSLSLSLLFSPIRFFHSLSVALRTRMVQILSWLLQLEVTTKQ